jgi:transposase
VAQVEPKALLGDKGYDADGLINSLEVRAIKAVIPPKSNRKVKRDCDFALYAERNLVERFFNTIKQYRGIATRYEKTARNIPRRAAPRLRARLAQMTTGPSLS